MPVPAGGGGASRWQLALLLGAPIALGLGYLYLRRRAAAVADAPAISAPVSLDDAAAASASASAEGAALEAALRFKVQGNKAFHAADYDEAASLYERAIAACPPDRSQELATFYQNRSACHEKRERWDLVKRDCTEALAHNNRYARAFLRRARAFEKSGDLAMALEDMTAACILEEFKVRTSLLATDRVLKALGRRHAREAIESRPPLAPSSRFVRAYYGSFSNDPSLGPAPPGDDSSGYAQARAAFDAERYGDVEAGCTKEIAEGGPRASQARLLRGTLRLICGRSEAALEDLTAVAENPAERDDARVNALIKRATLRLQAEEPAECVADFEEAARLRPDDRDLHFHRGQAHMLAGNLSEARSEFAAAVRLNGGPLARAQKCYAEYNELKMANRTDALPAVIEAFESVLADHPDYPETYVLFAEVLSDLGLFPRSEELFDSAIRLDPGNANVYVHKAILALKMSGDVDGAAALIKKAIEIDDGCLFAYETLGTIEVQRENLKEAIALFEKAIPLTRTEGEMTHIFSLRDAANAQVRVFEKWGIGPGPTS